jgi:signal transduction histidine kinase
MGAFALCESVVAWNDLLAPLVGTDTLLTPPLRTAVLAAGYAFLLAFALQTFLPKDAGAKRLARLLVLVHAAWALPYALALAVTAPNATTTARVAEGATRYLLAFPGGLLTGLGMRSQSYRTLEDTDWRRRVRPYLRLVEATAAAFGVLNLVLVSPAPFPPANVLNHTLVPFPPSSVWATVGLLWVMGLSLTLATIQRGIESWVENVERIQALSADRERISRELHDGIIQSIYATGLMLEGIQHYITTDPDKARAQLSRIMTSLNHTIQDIRRYIFDLRSDMPDDDLEGGIRRLLRDFHLNTLLETNLRVSGSDPLRLTVERRRHVFQIVREALANTSRHAHARRVDVDLDFGPESLNLTLADDGVGMETLMLGKGYGLRNIRERARMVDGKLKIESAPGEGVTLNLTIPY